MEISDAKVFLVSKFQKAGLSTNHSKRVYRILKDEFKVKNKDILVAGMLHDCLEDTDCTKNELMAKFGDKVATLVDEVSHAKNPTSDDYGEYHEKLLHVSDEAKLIKLADELDKIRRDTQRVKRVKGIISAKDKFVESSKHIPQHSLVKSALEDYKKEVKF